MYTFLYKKRAGENGKRGFTLIEMMVAVSLFSVVMVIASSALLTVIDADRRARAEASVLDNLDTALESMTRSIRVGSHYYCGVGSPGAVNDCGSGGTMFTFEPYGGNVSTSDQWIYSWSSSGPNAGEILRSTNGGASYLPLTATSSGLSINSLRFYVTGSTEGDGYQPKVTISVRGVAGPKVTDQVPFEVETTLTQRLYDL